MTSTAAPTLWSDRPELFAADVDELSALLDNCADDVSAGLLFTSSPTVQLDRIGRWQRLKDLAFFGQLREIVASHGATPEALQEVCGDEVGLAIGTGPVAGANLLRLALASADLPGLLEAGEAGMLTERHLRAVMHELDQVELTQPLRQAVIALLLASLDGQTPGELVKLLARLVLTVDLAAAQSRRDLATRGRSVQSYATADGQGALHVTGPLEQIGLIRARLRAELDGQVLHPDDERTRSQREFDVLVELLTCGTVDSRPLPRFDLQVLVPFSTASGGDLELAEVPGYGPILPSTARDLLQDASSVSQIAVDEQGTVISVSDPVPGPQVEHQRVAEQALAATTAPGDHKLVRGHRAAPAEVTDADETDFLDVDETDFLDVALRTMASPPRPRALGRAGYRPGARLARAVRVRDRTCTFPGCHRRVTDVDHRIPWPLGPTDEANLHCLCRHHHRAKQTSFAVWLDDEGNTVWRTRGGWLFVRRHQRY